MNHFHAFYENEGYGGTIIDINLPCPHPDATCDLPDRYVPADHYDDFTASDVLHLLIEGSGVFASLEPLEDGLFWLTVDGAVILTPEQAQAISPLFPTT